MAALLTACGPVDTGGSSATGPTDAGSGIGASDAGAAGAGTPAGGGGAGGNVTLSIASPKDGEDCKVSDKKKDHCTVKVKLSGAVLAAPGSCGGSSASCGHIDLYIDGTSCGSPNTQSSTTTFDAAPEKCPSIEGQHALSCELRNDQGDRLATSQTITVRVEEDD